MYPMAHIKDRHRDIGPLMNSSCSMAQVILDGTLKSRSNWGSLSRAHISFK